MEDIGYLIVRAIQDSPEVLQYLAQRRYALFSRLHEIVFYGKGGYDLDTVYHLPIWYRKFIYHEITEHYRQQAETMNGKNSGQTLTNTSNPVKGPGVAPRKADASARRSTARK